MSDLYSRQPDTAQGDIEAVPEGPLRGLSLDSPRKAQFDRAPRESQLKEPRLLAAADQLPRLFHRPRNDGPPQVPSLKTCGDLLSSPESLLRQLEKSAEHGDLAELSSALGDPPSVTTQGRARQAREGKREGSGPLIYCVPPY